MHKSGKRCLWCGGLFYRRAEERPSAFERRKHCDRSCQVATQNSDRAQRNRRANREIGIHDA